MLSKDSTNILYYDLLAKYYIEMSNYKHAYNLYRDAFRAYKGGYLLQKIALFTQFKLNQYVNRKSHFFFTTRYYASNFADKSVLKTGIKQIDYKILLSNQTLIKKELK